MAKVRPVLQEFVRWCAQEFEVSEERFCGRSTCVELVNQRRVSMAAAQVMFRVPLKETAQAFGKSSGELVRKAVEVCAEDPQMKHAVNVLAEKWKRKGGQR